MLEAIKVFFLKHIVITKRKLYRLTHKTTESGMYAAYYIVQKYINEERSDDFNAAYEELVNEYAQRSPDIEGVAMSKQIMGAMFALTKLTFFATNKDREKIYSWINREPSRMILQMYVHEAFFP